MSRLEVFKVKTAPTKTKVGKRKGKTIYKMAETNGFEYCYPQKS